MVVWTSLGGDSTPCRRHADWKGERDLSQYGRLDDSSMDGIMDACNRARTLLRENPLALGVLSGNRYKCSDVLYGVALLCIQIGVRCAMVR